MAAFAGDPISLPVLETSQVGEARRRASTLARSVGFDEQRTGEVAIVATELATNLARHAQGGELVIRTIPLGTDRAPGIELLSIDRGPGIANLKEAFRDGFSTGSGSPGTGLGAVRRLSDTFDLYTTPPAGTVIVSRLCLGGGCEIEQAPTFGLICLPKKGETACGDAYGIRHTGHGRTIVLLADGLGHGPQAATASLTAVRIFHEHADRDTVRIVEALHAGLRSTRGAAVAVLELRPGEHEVRFTGVGNIAAAVVAEGKARSMVSQNGTAGAEARRIQEFVYPWPAGALIVAHSDGLGSHWQLAQSPGLRFKHPSLVAGVLYRAHRRERDDVTVMVIGAAPPASAS